MTNQILNFKNWNTKYKTIPFENISLSDIIPAIKEGIKISKEEIEEIKNNSEESTFKNTIIPLQIGNKILDYASAIIGVLSVTSSSNEILKIEKEFSELITEFYLEVSMNQDLFHKVKNVYEKKDLLDLSEEEITILEKEYEGFIRSGVHLKGNNKKRFEKILKELPILSISFDENIKKEEGEYFLHVESEDKLKGLSKSTIEFCKKEAEKRNLKGFGFILNARMINLEILPFLKSRELRERLHRAVRSRCCQGNETDNQEIVRKITNLKLEKAKILGFSSYVDFALENRMAKTKDKVFSFLEELRVMAMPAAKKDVEEVSFYAKEKEGKDFTLMPWDFKYYSEKLREKKYSFNEEEVSEYFTLENVLDATFKLTSTLYKLNFKKLKDVQVWNSDVQVYEVSLDEKYLGLIYMDLFMRVGEKKGGAWVFDFVTQEENSVFIQRPHIQLCMNMKKEDIVLMNVDSTKTFLHEFGHVLHGLLSNVKYSSVAGINVYQDFIELPSQVMENFFYEKDLFLNNAAKHYKTGESMPNELYNKIMLANKFNKGYECLRQLSFGIQDMSYYSLEEPLLENIIEFEKRVQENLRLFSKEGRFKECVSTSFAHIFAGGYSAGYYSYKWAEVLDADAFEFMKKNNFSKEVMESFKKNILEKGGSVAPDILYKRFRGSMPTSEAMLKRDGLI